MAAESAVLHELSAGGFDLADIDADALQACRTVVERFVDQEIGVTDASLVVLAERLQTNRVLTLDRRHFTVLRTSSGERFELLPG